MKETKQNKVLYGETYFHKKEFIPKTRCCYCEHLNNKRCEKKNTKVHINKKRKCDFFVPDPLKIRLEKNKITGVKVTKRPDWYWLDKKSKKRFLFMTGVIQDG